MFELWGISIWVFAVVLFLIIEGASASLVSIWFCLGSMGALIVSIFTDSFAIQSGVFFIISIGTLIFTRPLAAKLINKKKDGKTNLDLIIGERGLVLEEIDNKREKGSIKIKGNIWTARSADDKIIEKDALVFVKKIEGVKLIVSKKGDL